MEFFTLFFIFILIILFLFIYLMNVRIKQLENELVDVRKKIILTDDELASLSRNIMDFKKLKI